jgi:leucyl aminopeptidase
LAFVGKGVTFDTGGLDLKPASGMRLMKKDMGGSATVSALAYFVQGARLSVPCDFYLALTENAVSEKSMRPGDVLFARNGTAVEIHNTDAEGRLALADAIDVAVRAPKAAERPELLVDVATLTGAMRVALGLDVAGYFSNDDDLAAEIEQAGLRAGETTWRMPLVPRYGRMLSSTIADLSNASDSGYGGAITAALFLQHFVGSVPWAHFDVMAFNPGPDGALSEGGNGQAFCTLAEFVLGRD